MQLSSIPPSPSAPSAPSATSHPDRCCRDHQKCFLNLSLPPNLYFRSVCLLLGMITTFPASRLSRVLDSEESFRVKGSSPTKGDLLCLSFPCQVGIIPLLPSGVLWQHYIVNKNRMFVTMPDTW